MLVFNAVKRLPKRCVTWGSLVAVVVVTTVRAEHSEIVNNSDPIAQYTAHLETAHLETVHLGGGGKPLPGSPEYDTPTYADEAPAYEGTPDFGDFSSGFASAGSSAGAGLVGGYIDPARIASRVRVRYDNMKGANSPSRAEFLYPTVGSLGGPGPAVLGLLQGQLDMQEMSTYVEWAIVPRLSIFGDFAIRAVGPLDLDPPFRDGTQTGAGDMKFGARYGIIDTCDEALTFQLRVTTPTGEALRGLGVGHTSLDLALLYQRQINDRLIFFGELQDWQTTSARTLTGGTPFDGQKLDANVLRFGVGLGYDVWQDCCNDRRLTGVFEVVGWNVLDGFDTPLDGTAANVRDAAGDTIVNGKYGVRYTTGPNTVYVGYGHNWTSNRWYSDLFRLEVAHAF